MSSFAGRMKEYPDISLDRFDRENLHARAYFLSHCHKDHMKGLKGPLLKRKLKFSLTVKLYCSFVTKELLLSNPKYGFWEDHIEALELDSPTHISLIDETSGESEDVVVTLLSAGHCPGSAMFLFEGAQGTVLYTGDFRLASGAAARMEYLHSGDWVKDIQSVYLDTTFYDPRFYQIPSREACLAGIRELVQDWVSLSPYHVVWLNCKAAYGYEYLFTNLGQEFGMQIHVKRLDMFQKMPEILSHVTTDRATQIHACRHPQDEEMFRANRLPCGSTAKDGTPLRIISIKPSTMWFGERTRKTSVVVRMGGSSYRACFSFHSSYSEIKDFLSYVCPVNIYPNVIPMGRTVEDVTELLKPMCRENAGRSEVVYKPLGILKRAREECASRGSDSDDELFGQVALAPRRRMLPLKEAEPPNPERPPPTGAQAGFQPELRPSPQTANYMDCTESNDDDDDEDDNELSKPVTEERSVGQPSGDAPPAAPACPRREPPSWDSFFTAEPVPTDEISEPDNSQTSLGCSTQRTTSPSHSTQHSASQSSDLFAEEEEDDDEDGSSHLPSSQSTHESCSQPDTVPVQSEQREAGQPGSQGNARTNGELGGGTRRADEAGPALSDGRNGQSEQADASDQRSDSQVSSDFELPATPGNKEPRPDELKELYRKLAAGEEVGIRKGHQGCI